MSNRPRPDGILPPLCRGEPFSLRVGPTDPAVDFTGRTVEVLLDAQDGTRTPCTSYTPAGDGSYVDAALAGSWCGTSTIADGIIEVHIVVDGDHWAWYSMTLWTAAGGVIT